MYARPTLLLEFIDSKISEFDKSAGGARQSVSQRLGRVNRWDCQLVEDSVKPPASLKSSRAAKTSCRLETVLSVWNQPELLLDYSGME